MVNFHKHNPLLKSRLLAQMKSDSAEGLLQLLSSLSVAEFRTAGYLLAEEILPEMPSPRYWTYFCKIVPVNSKAYLGTFLKAAIKMYGVKRLTLDKSAISLFAENATLIDKRKTLDALMPVVRSTEEVRLLVYAFCNDCLEMAAPYLLKAATPVSYYYFFNMLREAEASPALLKNYIVTLIKHPNSMALNMACIIQRYFGLKEIPCNFSLRLESYELSRLEQGEEYFMKVLSR